MTNAVRFAHDPADAPQPVDRSVKVSTAAAILDCDESYVRRLFRDKKLRGHRLGIRGVRIYLSSIQAYQEAQNVDPAAPAPASPQQRRRRPSAQHQEATAYLKSLGVL